LDLATNAKWLPFIDVDVLKVPQMQKTNEGMVEDAMRLTALASLLKLEGLIVRQPIEDMITQFENMIRTYPRTAA